MALTYAKPATTAAPNSVLEKIPEHPHYPFAWEFWKLGLSRTNHNYYYDNLLNYHTKKLILLKYHTLSFLLLTYHTSELNY
jgi:hypothetical protein